VRRARRSRGEVPHEFGAGKRLLAAPPRAAQPLQSRASGGPLAGQTCRSRAHDEVVHALRREALMGGLGARVFRSGSRARPSTRRLARPRRAFGRHVVAPRFGRPRVGCRRFDRALWRERLGRAGLWS